MIKLSEIVFEDLKLNKNDKQIKIKGLSSDSRNIKSGYLFASLSEKADKYIINAVNNGAVALLLSNKVVQRYSNIKKIGIIDVDDPKEFYGLFKDVFNG